MDRSFKKKELFQIRDLLDEFLDNAPDDDEIRELLDKDPDAEEVIAIYEEAKNLREAIENAGYG